ncbi:carbon storage regulator [Domibacillus mangrovi]|uniref:Translational regulator CsrA n=1 Tax=Domibacillus mangrovi TaxID=1714354 RepID=A0A1Q5P5S2_9BACI|nr:carbon storage regulator [Domibacillus mangrovi]OKL37442.1 carbon storage regulator [Domibacillus mangrovi]
MLVLGRKPGEYVLIDNNIKVKVIKSDEGHLRLAIEAPKHISIVRGELWEENNIALEMAKKVEASAT